MSKKKPVLISAYSKQRQMMASDRKKAMEEARENRVRAAMNCPVVFRLSVSQELAELRDLLELERANLDYAAGLVEKYQDSSARNRYRRTELQVATLERRVKYVERAVC
ncbi:MULTISPECIES: hypothetical protein [Dethiosulfovibrio]|uniref:Uncharacterized protein n=2 Tax=Dethiosulfovibrio TaxID=47054 RepID=A0ABS9ET28_9BACT|nr:MULTISPECIES: hypothetical protein [Dethiosulfovibrio]MCF4115115.1 hypothetical protein [Dethiosulfovibrio russensis]MCF4143606.1 hypothetical protein [Dethiosulfovibrio marinus]MCF4146077.1 hypothetical protein [Dethiosulfovibrio acidaminovorans]